MNQQQRSLTEQIWRELSDRLRQFVRSRITSVADVDDVLQTVFLRIHSRIGDLRSTDRLEAWVFQITRNAVTDYFRKRREADSDVKLLVDDSSETNNPTASAELAGCLESMMKRLPEEQRRALSMYEFDGMSQKDIAERESTSLSAVKSRVQRARKSLNATLKECCEIQFDKRGKVLDYEATNTNCCDREC